jgi:hypothetical protein
MQGFGCDETAGGIWACRVSCDEMPAADQIGVLHEPFTHSYDIYVWARDKDHAIKIAAEKFAHQRAIDAGMAS